MHVVVRRGVGKPYGEDGVVKRIATRVLGSGGKFLCLLSAGEILGRADEPSRESTSGPYRALGEHKRDEKQ